MNLIFMAIPVFILFICLEAGWSYLKKSSLYRLNDTISDLSCGVFEQVLHIFTRSLVFYNFYAISENFALLHWSTESWGAFILTFLLVDFAYYWYHRCAHRIKALWATHIVHHQSEEYNLAVALRQSAFGNFFSAFFYIPIALMGANPIHFSICYSLNLIYQFFIHTRLVHQLPKPVELIMNTPSHHRVHHGRNKNYLDKNYAGVFIIWDRFFGTFENEREEVRYGITTPLNSFNPIWANLHYWFEIFEMSTHQKSLSEKLRLLISSPDQIPESYLRLKEPTQSLNSSVYDPSHSTRIKIQVSCIGVIILASAFGFLGLQDQLPFYLKCLAGSTLVLGLWVLNSMLESREDSKHSYQKDHALAGC